MLKKLFKIVTSLKFKNPFKRYICIKQYDITDCGAACLATVCKHYGLKTPITKI
ncbi:MAG: cysteine peptidase family C39 domain-containing protein, partial [Ruminiclostridium sp.]